MLKRANEKYRRVLRAYITTTYFSYIILTKSFQILS